MRKLVTLLVAGLLVMGAAGHLVSNAPGQRRLPARAVQPAGQSGRPDASAYSLFLPLINKRYVPGYASPFGISTYAALNDSDGRLQMQAAGSAWVTLALSWADVEPTAPISGVHTYDWSMYDAEFAQAQAAGMAPFVMFTANPTWAAQYSGGPVYNEADLVSVVGAAAQRYNGADPANPIVHYWTFYGEPDNGNLNQAKNGKGYWGNNPNGYADMLADVSAAIHAANPNAVVMNGGMAYDFFTTSGGYYVQSFLPKLLDRLNTKPGGAAAVIGGVAFHYYPISPGVWPTIKEKAQAIRSVMTAHGAGNLPLFVPEMGYWSAASAGSSEPQQARTLVEMFVRGLSVGIREMSWLTVFDGGGGSESHGLFRGTDLNSPKPSYTAYGTLTSELLGAHYHGPLTGTGIEGYVFDMSYGGQKSVVWATQPSALVTFHQSCIRRVDTMGNVTTPIADGSAWDQDHLPGQITLQVLQDQPIYVGGC